MQAGRTIAHRARLVQPWRGPQQKRRTPCREAAQFNKPDAANPAIASRLHGGCPWRGVTDPTSEGSRATYFYFLSGHFESELARASGDG